MILFVALVLLIYLIFMGLVWFGWDKTPDLANIDTLPKTRFSIIVAVRNEAENIVSLLFDLVSQEYPDHSFEIILVNDHSEDQTMELANDFLEKQRIAYQILFLEGFSGKKNALQMGIQASRFEWIMTIDGDCRVKNEWLKATDEKIRSSRAKMVVGPVLLNGDDSIFGQIQQMEFSTLIASAAAGLFFSKPNMCNGANLAFEKLAFDSVGGYASHSQLASGDDEFLMHAIWKKYPGNVLFNKSTKAIVSTPPSPNWRLFSAQRQRWASKWENYLQSNIKFLAVFVFLIQLGWIFAFWGSIWNRSLEYFLFAYGVKVFIDAIFLQQILKWFGQSFRTFAFFVLEVFYPFYVVIFALLGRKKSFIWKERFYK